MANGVWTGHLTFGMISIPVRLVPAARSEGVSFNMLHRDDLSRVNQKLFCSTENKEISRSEVLKGYEWRKDEYVVIDPQDIKDIEPKTTETMELLEFVQANEVDPVYFDSSYYIKPEDAGKSAYALFAKAMQSGSYYGVAKVAMHNREYTVVIRPYKGILILHTMFYQNEVRDPEFIINAEPKEKEVEFALQLITAMSDEWNPTKYSDTFVEALKKMITEKIEGKPVTKKEKAVKKSAVPDIMEALKKSIAELDAKKPAKKGKK